MWIPVIIRMSLMGVLGAALPVAVLLFSKDESLKEIGRSVIKYVVGLPFLLAIIVVGLLQLIT